jgi:hypothetical protein
MAGKSKTLHAAPEGKRLTIPVTMIGYLFIPDGMAANSWGLSKAIPPD